MNAAYEAATERLLVARHARTVHLAKLIQGEADDDWKAEFARIHGEVREALFDQVKAELDEQLAAIERHADDAESQHVIYQDSIYPSAGA